MKKLLTLCLGFIPCAALAATNKISMVTFFPVPYVAYSQLKATDQMDIGLTNSCDMTLGCSEDSATLNATQVNVKGGKLNLDGGRGIKGNTLSLGNGNGEGKISFQNVRIQTGNMESMNAQGMKASNLNLFGKAFPSCKAANSASGGQMQWTSLKLKGADSSELYLACGPTGESSVCQPTDSRGATYTEPCPSGQTGGPIKYTWNTSTCQYDTSGSCEGAQEVLVHCMTYHCKMGEQEWADLPPGSVDKLYTRFMGCKLPNNSPVNVTIYRKNMLKSSYSKWDTLYSGTQITDSCGWSTAFDDYRECYYSFALNQSGASSITQTVAGKTYEIVLEQDFSEEDDGYNNSFCSLQHSSW